MRLFINAGIKSTDMGKTAVEVAIDVGNKGIVEFISSYRYSPKGTKYDSICHNSYDRQPTSRLINYNFIPLPLIPTN